MIGYVALAVIGILWAVRHHQLTPAAPAVDSSSIMPMAARASQSVLSANVGTPENPDAPRVSAAVIAQRGPNGIYVLQGPIVSPPLVNPPLLTGDPSLGFVSSGPLITSPMENDPSTLTLIPGPINVGVGEAMYVPEGAITDPAFTVPQLQRTSPGTPAAVLMLPAPEPMIPLFGRTIDNL